MKIIIVVCQLRSESCGGGVGGIVEREGVLGDCLDTAFHHYCHTIKAEW